MDKRFEEERKKAELFILKMQTGDNLVIRFMNDENGEKMEEKIEVCKKLIDGEAPEDIDNYYDVLDDMPKNDGGAEEHW